MRVVILLREDGRDDGAQPRRCRAVGKQPHVVPQFRCGEFLQQGDGLRKGPEATKNGEPVAQGAGQLGL